MENKTLRCLYCHSRQILEQSFLEKYPDCVERGSEDDLCDLNYYCKNCGKWLTEEEVNQTLKIVKRLKKTTKKSGAVQ